MSLFARLSKGVEKTLGIWVLARVEADLALARSRARTHP
jgi:hypothetical protein